MKKFLFILLFLPITGFSQLMFEVDYAWQADILLYEVDYPYQADIKYWVANYQFQADEQKHHWYLVRYPHQARYKIFWVDYRYQADKLVFRVNNPWETY
tara:strand:- start:1340 stop:1636 length:297 start_codon:yes stop_codon:yes gene_type:complete